MDVIILAFGFSALFLIAMHLYCAFKFGLTMKYEVGESWNPRGNPEPIAFFYSDLKRFKSSNKELIDSNAVVRRSVTRFERSWKYGMPMVLLLAVMAGLLQRLIWFI